MKRILLAITMLAAAITAPSCSGLYTDIVGTDTLFVTIEHWFRPLTLSHYLDAAAAGTSATAPGVSAGDNGDALVTWLQPAGSYAHVFARERRCGIWQAPVDISDTVNPAGLDCSGHQSAMNARGDTVLVWAQVTAGTKAHIFGREYRNGSWGTIGRLDPGDGYSADNPRVAIDDTGSSIVVWGRDSASGHQLYMSEYRGSSWSAPVQISPGVLDAFMPRVAMDNNGAAVIVWYGYSDASSRHIFRSQYRAGAWTHPASLAAFIDPATPYAQYARDARIAMGDNGDAAIAFIAKSDVTYSHVYRSEYRSGTWSDPVDMSTDYIDPIGQSSSEPDIAMDRYGNAIIVWKQFDGMIYDRIYKSEYREGAWTDPSGLQDPIDASLPSGNSKEPRVAMDDRGNAVIVRSEVYGPSVFTHIFKAVYRNGSWRLLRQPAYDILDPFSPIYPNQKSEKPDVAMAGSGRVLVVWQGNVDATYTHVFMARGVMGLVPVPW